MSILRYKKPITPSQRHQCLLDHSELNKKKKLKSKSFFLKNKAGRNNQGKITSFHKGGGHKKLYRKLTYQRKELSGIVETIEYDPFRSANIARIFFESKNSHVYILAPEGLKKGHFITSFCKNSLNLRFKNGNSFFLEDLPLGAFVHNIAFLHKGSAARSAGSSAQLISKNNKYCRFRLNSGEIRIFPIDITATLGNVSNFFHKHIVLGKAGRSRWLNKRPTVRGVAMNPIDHPHGGGEGKTSGGRPSVTPWGKVAHGQKTRSKKRPKLIKKK